MKKMNLKNFYDSLYSKNPNVFRAGSRDFLRDIVEQYELPRGRALDIGAGEGITSLFLRDAGYVVDAVDFSTAAFGAIDDEGENITTHYQDIRSFVFSHSYTLIFFPLVAHHFEKSVFKELVAKAKRMTDEGGFHIHRIFTTQSDFYKTKVDEGGFYDDDSNLDALYEGWEVLFDEKVRCEAKVAKAVNEVRQVVFVNQ